MLDIGTRIKELRKAQQLTGKELAERIGMSPSQVTRLEKGQRRVDFEIILRLAEALQLPPAAFFESQEGVDSPPLTPKRAKELALSELHLEIGKLVRSARRQKHLTVDDLARRTGHSRAYVLAVEQGRRSGLEGEFMKKATKILQIDPFRIVEQQDAIIRELGLRVHRLSFASVESSSGGIPILIGDEGPYPREFDREGEPVAAIEGALEIPELKGLKAFALRIRGPEMATGPFREKDLIVFAAGNVAPGAFAFVHYGKNSSAFCQVFMDDTKTRRLQYLRKEVAPVIMPVDELVRAWPLVAHVVVGSPRHEIS